MILRNIERTSSPVKLIVVHIVTSINLIKKYISSFKHILKSNFSWHTGVQKY